MTDKTIALSRSSGPVTDTSLTNWSVTFNELGAELSKPEVGEKDGPYLVRGPVNANCKRSDDNITRASVAVLDGDSRIIPGTGEIIEGAPPPELVHEALRDLDIQHIIYTSHSHCVKGGRYRVIVILSRELMTADELRVCVDWLIDQLQSSGVWLCSVKENYVWSQPWFFPRIATENSPFTYLQHDGDEPLDVEACIEWAKDNNGPDQKAAEVGESSSKLYDPDSPIGRYLAEHGNPQSMLKMLIAHQYELKGQTFINGAQAFRLLAPGSSTGVAGVVLYMTKKKVWRAYSHHGEHDPLSHRAEDAFGLYTLFMHDGDQDAALEGIGIFKRDIAYEEVCSADVSTAEGRAKIDAYRKQQQRAFNNKYGMLMIEGKAVVVYREVNKNTGFVESIFAATTTIAAYYANRRLPTWCQLPKGGYSTEWKRTVYEDWLTSHYRRSYPQPMFSPQPGVLATTGMPPAGGPYNLYVGTSLTPLKGDCSPILQHIREVWCRGNNEPYQYVIKWLARMVQKPGEQGRTVIVLRSGEGAGKNIIFDIFDRYFGSHSVMLTKPEDMAGFNDHLGLSVFVFLNEALWGGNKSVEGTMKSTIADDVLLVERKYLPKFKARNCTHIVVATNNDWAVPVGIDDRRFLILDASEHRKGDFVYFSSLVDHIKGGGQEALIHHLLHEVDIANFDVRQIPEINSATKLDHKIRTADSITRWWIDVLTEGGFDVPRDTTDANGHIRTSNTFIDWPISGTLSISTHEFYASYSNATRSGHKESGATLAKKVAELLGDGGLKRKRPWNEGNRDRLYCLPNLLDARAEMEKRLKQAGPWAHIRHDESRAREEEDEEIF